MNHNAQLSNEVESLSSKLESSDARLADALKQLAAATTRKQTVERAICRQLSKTHQVLKKAKGNLHNHRTDQEPSGNKSLD